jgi:hypothetical protein
VIGKKFAGKYNMAEVINHAQVFWILSDHPACSVAPQQSHRVLSAESTEVQISQPCRP